MKFIEYVNRLERMDQLIRLKATGCPKAFAEKLCISERYMYELLNVLKQMGAELCYDKYRESYVYLNPCKLKLGFEKIDKNSIKGGQSFSTELIFQYEYLGLQANDTIINRDDHLQNFNMDKQIIYKHKNIS